MKVSFHEPPVILSSPDPPSMTSLSEPIRNPVKGEVHSYIYCVLYCSRFFNVTPSTVLYLQMRKSNRFSKPVVIRKGNGSKT